MRFTPAIPWWHVAAGFVCLSVLTASPAAIADDRSWQPIVSDGLRDPKSPATRILQQPRDALSPLAPDNAGNQVRWVKALKEGQINPRSFLRTDRKWETYDKDVLLNLNGGMPVVRFPHSAHTPWLDCANCHDHLFKKQRGASQISMFLILQGEQCGVCHGAVAFPLTECSRCHSVKRADALAELEREAAAAKAAGDSKSVPPSSLPAPVTSPSPKPVQREKVQ
jgi:c(7)-type cytochrome triheme protein